MTRRLVLLSLLGVAACATLPPPRLVNSGETFAELEPLYLAWPSAIGLTIRVASKGCTSRADWTFFVEHSDGAARLAFARKSVDDCRSAGGQVDLAFTWAELGLPRGADVVLLNPLVR